MPLMSNVITRTHKSCMNEDRVKTVKFIRGINDSQMLERMNELEINFLPPLTPKCCQAGAFLCIIQYQGKGFIGFTAENWICCPGHINKG